MLKVTDSHVGSETESAIPCCSADPKDLHRPTTRSRNYQFRPAALVGTFALKPGVIFVVAPDVDDETLISHACESLASASVMAGEFAGKLEGTQRNMMLALQQVILLGELALNRLLVMDKTAGEAR
jgi:hypothetical protein